MNAVIRGITLLVQITAIALLGLIAYNTGVGKTLPVHHPGWMACDGRMSRSLFYSTLLKQNEAFVALASQVKDASTTAEIDRLVSGGANIDAPRTLWFESVTEPGKCQAQIFLKKPNKDGENTAYIGFDVAGFADPQRSFANVLQGGSVLESIRLDMAEIKWFKE
jgi:hypothetical protein